MTSFHDSRAGDRRPVPSFFLAPRLLAGLSCSLGVLLASQAVAQTTAQAVDQATEASTSAASQNTIPENTAPRDTTPESMASRGSAPESTASRDTTSRATGTGLRQPHTLPAVSVHERRDRDVNAQLRLDARAITGSQLELSTREIPASVTVVDRETIEARGARTTQDVLNSMPGVHTSATHGDVHVAQRGFRGASVNQVYNGVNLQYTIATQPVGAWVYEKVEDIGGPSSFLHGAGGVGGTVNYVTKTATRHDISEAQIRLGSRRYRQLSLGLNRRIAGNGSGQNDHYFRIDTNSERGGEWVDDNREHSSQIVTSLLSDLGGGFTHTLAYEYHHARDHRPYWGTPTAQPPEGELRVLDALRAKNYNSADGMYMQRVQWLRSVAQWKIDDRFEIRNTFYGYDAIRDYRNVEEYTLNSTNTQVTREGILRQRHDQRLFGDRIDATLRSSLAGHRSDWGFGAVTTFNRQTTYPSSNYDLQMEVDPYSFITEYFYDLPGISSVYEPRRHHHANTLAIYLENRTDLTPALKLLTGLRHERVKVDVNDLDPEDGGKASRTYHPTTGRVGLAWDITPQMMVYTTYATAADPASGNLASTYGSQIGNNLRMTTGRMLELGTKLNFWDNRGNATLALYQINRKNIAVTDPEDRRRTLLIGEQQARGLETQVGLQLTKAWSLQGNFSYTDAEYKKYTNRRGVSLAGKTPVNIPKTITNLWTTYAITDDLSISGSIRRESRIYGDETNTVWWPAYTVGNVSAEYRLSPTMKLTASVDNVTDKVYSKDVQSNMAVLSPPRTVYVGLKVSL